MLIPLRTNDKYWGEIYSTAVEKRINVGISFRVAKNSNNIGIHKLAALWQIERNCKLHAFTQFTSQEETFCGRLENVSASKAFKLYMVLVRLYL